MNKIIIAIDGYSGCGKSTTAKIVAEKLNYIYIDSGAMYRAVTLYFLRHSIPFDNPEAAIDALKRIDIRFNYNPHTHKSETYLNGEIVEAEIRSMAISDKVSEVSKIHEVREAMVAQQQEMGGSKGIVMDGRDIGTQVFPQAELKIFMEADVYIRAERRQAEMLLKGDIVSISDIIHNLQKRDHIDTSRAESPLCKAEDAIELDSTTITIEEQTQYVIALAQKIIAELNTLAMVA